jgi:hypothetical protein
MEATCSSKMSVDLRRATQYFVPEDGTLQVFFFCYCPFTVNHGLRNQFIYHVKKVHEVICELICECSVSAVVSCTSLFLDGKMYYIITSIKAVEVSVEVV